MFPLDPLPDEPADWAGLAQPQAIARRCEAQIRRCRAVLANLTPFRGPSADAGTVYEIGYARGLGLPVFGYSTVATGFTARSLAAAGAPPDAGPDWRDRDGMAIERFGLADNLMIPGSLAGLVVEDAADRWTDLTVFERCVRLAAQVLAIAGTPASPG